MEKTLKVNVLKSRDAVNVVCDTLRRVDPRLVNHGMRVAYILLKMLCDSTTYSAQKLRDICVLGIFHDIGAYKTDEIDRMVQFETENVWEHSIYGYLFLKHLTPLTAHPDAVLYHHYDYEKFEPGEAANQEMALLLGLADRVDILACKTSRPFSMEPLLECAGKKFDPAHVKLFMEKDEKYQIVANLRSGAYEKEMLAQMELLRFTDEQIDQYLWMLVYSIDFRSVYTVSHTINTVAYSVEIAKRMGYSGADLQNIYYGSLLHDLGKIAIPVDILEKPGKLTRDEMKIMKKHVSITEEIIKGLVDDTICQIAIRHHEKLDGTGYPYGLDGDQLTESQRIVAVGDIISALMGKRSYKNELPREEIFSILTNLRDNHKICPKVCNLVFAHYDEIARDASKSSRVAMDVYTHITDEFASLYAKFAVNDG